MQTYQQQPKNRKKEEEDIYAIINIKKEKEKENASYRKLKTS